MLTSRIQSEFGVTVEVKLLPPHSIPRTSSGKPARAEAKKRYLSEAMSPMQLAGYAQ